MLSTDVNRDEMIARYLAGKLTDAESERFEAYWAAHPEITRDLEASARLTLGLRDLRTRGELAGALRDRWWSRRMSLLAVAASLSAVAAGVVGWRMVERVSLVPLAPTIAALTPRAQNPLAKGATYSLLRLRSTAANDATIDLPADPRAIELRVLPEATATDGRYRLTLAPLDADGALGPESASEPLAAEPDGFVTIYVDSRELKAGRYRLRVGPAAAATPSDTTEFRLSVRPANGA